MDTLELIKEKIGKIRSEEYLNDLSFIIVHINRAEKYFKLGKETREIDYFNDVIYRTNQAYEGGLRCAYKILLEKDHSSKTTSKLEEELTTQNILNKRVKNMFSIYRNDWRNESVHHYDFIVDQSEALMAINSVSSFIYLLLDQIKEKDTLIQAENEKQNIKNLPFSDFIVQSLLLYAKTQNSFLKEDNKLEESMLGIQSEMYLIHSLKFYLQSLDDEIEVFENYRINSKTIDLYIKNKKTSHDEEQYIELKFLKNSFAIKNIIYRTREECKLLNIQEIILFIWNGFGDYKLTENKKEDITIKIISRI